MLYSSSIPARMPAGGSPPVRNGHTSGRQGDRSVRAGSQDTPPAPSSRPEHDKYLSSELARRGGPLVAAGARDGRRRIGLAYKRRARHRRRRTQGAPVPRGARPGAQVGAKPAGAAGAHVNAGRGRVPRACDEPSFRNEKRTPGPAVSLVTDGRHGRDSTV